MTPQFGVEALFGRWQLLRVASAQHSPDLLADVRFGDVLDLVLTHRASTAPQSFDILAAVGKVKR